MATRDPAARVTEAEVKEVFETDMTDAQIAAFINMAHRLVNRNLPATDHTADELHDIELLLSAHFAALNDPRVSQEEVGEEFSVRYQGQTAKGLEATLYGQQALQLDYTGRLAALGKQQVYLKVSSAYD